MAGPAPPRAASTTRPRTGVFTVNIADAGHARSIMSIVAKAKRWRTEIAKVSERTSVFIMMREEDIAERYKVLGAEQRMSRIPGMSDLCHKASFSKLMRADAEDCPAFVPRTFTVPCPSSQIAALRFPVIFKPDEGAAGDGIFILNSAADLNKKVANMRCTGAVVQQYLSRPMLLNGFKWDIRVYAFVLSLEPLRVFLAEEGLVRVCTQPYVAPSSRNLHKVECHLTNYSVSKYSADYVHTDDPLDGSQGTKRTLSSTLLFLQGQGHDVDSLKNQIKEIVSVTTEAMAAGLCELDAKGRHSCFHVLGFDIIFDERGKAWLLEVNNSPSLGIDSVFAVEGPYAQSPPDPPADAPYAPLISAARAEMGSKVTRVCKCMSHHRPHLHAPSAVDLVTKFACVADSLIVVRRDMAEPCARSCAQMAAGTGLEVVHDKGQRTRSP